MIFGVDSILVMMIISISIGLPLRVYLGYQWIESGWGKITNPAWIQGGEALKGFWERAVVIPDTPARPLITFDWYRNFIQFMLDSGNYV